MSEDITCPYCGNTVNFHFNYDYSVTPPEVDETLCNECGKYFDEEISKLKYKHSL